MHEDPYNSESHVSDLPEISCVSACV